MLDMRDRILEGVREFDFDHLKALADGEGPAGTSEHIERLEAKGWVERYGDIHLITLTGRTLLERPPKSEVERTSLAALTAD
jgi:hypothetical protein